MGSKASVDERLYRELLEGISEARAMLDDLQRLGLSGIALPVSTTEPAAAAEPAVRGETLEEIRYELENCRRCPLCTERRTIVFGVGNPRADLVLVGEAPGREEDERGEPFVGEAGRLLDRILFAMGLQRDKVYICNVEKCRPPGNRDPRPEEIEACEPFLIRQLNAIRPRLIVTLGKFAAQTLLRTETPISRLRGKWHVYQGIALMPTYHPAYLLRNPEAKRDVWEDMKRVLQRLREEQG